MFRITVASVTDRTVSLFVEGDLVLGEPTQQLRQTLTGVIAAYQKVTLDIGRLKRIDSTGVGVLVECHSVAEKRSKTLRVTNIIGSVRNVLLLVKLLTLFDAKAPDLAA